MESWSCRRMPDGILELLTDARWNPGAADGCPMLELLTDARWNPGAADGCHMKGDAGGCRRMPDGILELPTDADGYPMES